jgi:hypothetical protein
MSVIVEPGRTFFDNSGNVLNSGSVTFYVAGSVVTKKAIYPTAVDQAAATNALGNPQTLTSAGRLQQQVHGGNAYRLIVKDSLGATVLDEDNVVTTDYTALSVNTVAALKALTVSSLLTGTTTVVTGYYAAGDGGGGTYIYDSGSSATDNGGTIIQPTAGSGRWLLQHDGEVSLKQFGARGNGTDDAAGYIPVGVYDISAVSLTYSGVVKPIKVRGAGKYSTYLRKLAGTTTPIMTITAASAYENYVVFEDMTFRGNAKAGSGIKLTNVGRGEFNRVMFDTCAKGVEMDGALVWDFNNCSFLGNTVGYYARKSSANVFPNLVTFRGGEARGNTTFGFDIGDGQSVVLKRVDISGNGTTANVATGGMMVRGTIDDETGFGAVQLDRCWFESNFGRAFQAETSVDGQIIFNGGEFYSTESIAGARNPIYIAGARWVVLRDVIAPSATDTVTINATNSMVEGGIITTLVDNATNQYHNTVTSGGPLTNESTQVRVLGAASTALSITTDAPFGGSTSDTTFGKAGTGRVRMNTNGVVAQSWENGKLGFFTTAPIAKPAVAGAKAGNVALTNLCIELANLGLITNNTT